MVIPCFRASGKYILKVARPLPVQGRGTGVVIVSPGSLSVTVRFFLQGTSWPCYERETELDDLAHFGINGCPGTHKSLLTLMLQNSQLTCGKCCT